MQSLVSTGSSPEARQVLNEENTSSSTSTSSPKDTPESSSSAGANAGVGSGTPPPAAGPPHTVPLHLNPSFSSGLSLLPATPSLSQDEKSLAFFRTRMLPYFPFIHLPTDIGAHQLSRDRPFLFQAIVTVTTFSTRTRLVKAEELKRTLFTSAFSNVESNIDLLFGLLTYLAWGSDAFLGGADLASRLMMLAMSLVYDLRLFKPSPPDIKLMMALTQGRSDEFEHNPVDETSQSFMEKQRALLACFVLSSKYV